MDPDGFNAYVTFVIAAVLGKMAEADSILKDGTLGPKVRAMAAHYRRTLPLPLKKPLWRGLLIEPDGVVKVGGRHYLDPHPDLTFASWTESKDVACWFADPATFVSGFVASFRPGVRGWIMRRAMPKARVLWHHTWTALPMPDGRRLPLKVAGRMFGANVFPEVDMDQFDWNLDTQREVVTLPQDKRQEIRPIAKVGCPSAATLDAKLKWPATY